MADFAGWPGRVRMDLNGRNNIDQAFYLHLKRRWFDYVIRLNALNNHYLRVKMYSLHGILNTSMNVRKVKGANSSTFWELVHFIAGHRPDVPL